MPAGQRGCQFLSPLWVERLLLISHALKRLLQSFKVSRIKDACFTASLFQGFITHNSSPNLGRCPRGGGSVHPIVNQDSVCLLWGEAEVRVAPTMTKSSVNATSLPNAQAKRIYLILNSKFIIQNYHMGIARV